MKQRSITVTATVTAIVAALPLLYFVCQRAGAAQYQKDLQVCTEKFEQIRTDAAELESTEQYPFQKHRWDYIQVSNFAGGLAAFSGTWENREKRGIVDFNGNIVLEYQGASIDYFSGFSGFENGRTKIFVYEHEAVPWGFLLPYGNPVPRIWGTLDCTGKVTLER